MQNHDITSLIKIKTEFLSLWNLLTGKLVSLTKIIIILLYVSNN